MQNLVKQIEKLDAQVDKLEADIAAMRPLVPMNARMEAELASLHEDLASALHREATDQHTIKRLQDRVDHLVSELKECRDRI